MLDLDQLSKEERYNIPEGYFENLTDNIMDNIHKEERRRRNVWMSSIAAVCLVVISSVLFITINNNNKQKEAGTLVETPVPENKIDEQMIEYYSAELTEIDYYNF
ncbi:MAG: hypothetical protein K6A41_02955 [Bacteroidales bacterium]|nr:hypothetical protein [Bacteroidales bacterium]